MNPWIRRSGCLREGSIFHSGVANAKTGDTTKKSHCVGEGKSSVTQNDFLRWEVFRGGSWREGLVGGALIRASRQDLRESRKNNNLSIRKYEIDLLLGSSGNKLRAFPRPSNLGRRKKR